MYKLYFFTSRENFVKSSDDDEGKETTLPTSVTSFCGATASSSSKFCTLKEMFINPIKNIKRHAIPNLPLKKCLLIATKSITKIITEKQAM